MAATKKNIIDRFMSFISAEAGARRARARALESLYEGRSYDAAGTGRRFDGWFGSSRDANSELEGSAARVRYRIRELIRNNPWAGRALQAIVANTIGPGIIGLPEIEGDEKATQDYQKLWKSWSESTKCDFNGRHDFYGLQAIAKRAAVQDGDCFIRQIRVEPTINDPIPLKLMLLEVDYLDTNKSDKNIIQGIEFNDKGQRVAYWMFDNHPGGRQNWSHQSKRVPADQIIHYFKVDRPGQERGVSWFAPVAMQLYNLDIYIHATIDKQKVASAFCAFIYDANPDAAVAGKKKTPITDKIEPLAVEILPPGKDIKFPSNPAANDFDPFVKSVLRGVASGLNITYEALTGDLASVNFSSGRMGWLEFMRNIDSWRWHHFIPSVCDGVAGWFSQAASILDSRFSTDRVKWMWTPPRREMIDPTAETNSAINAIRGGIKSLPEVIREMGDDPERKLKEISDANKKLDELGLILDSDPRRTMKAGVIQTGHDASKIGGINASMNSDDESGDESNDTEEAEKSRFFEDQNGQLWKKTQNGFEKVEA